MRGSRSPARLVALGAAGLAAALSGACGEDPPTHGFVFEAGAAGWRHDLADLPADAEADEYEIEFEHGELPAEIDPPGRGLFLSGRNFSDDLFMFIKREITGLEPGVRYRVRAELELASDAPAGCFGIGGAPGEDVHLKLGTSTREPDVVEDDGGWLRLSVDKGNRADEGERARNIGTVENGLEECAGDVPFRRIQRAGSAPVARASASGSLWIFLGTDSGFEGTTSIYYDRIDLWILPE